MRTLDQINEDIDYLLTEGEQLREEEAALTEQIEASRADYRRAEHEHELGELYDMDSTWNERRAVRASIRRNDAELALAQQERWEHNVTNTLAAESEALFDAKLRHAAAYEAYGEAVREYKRREYDDWQVRAGASIVQVAKHTALCAAAQHLSNVQAVFADTQDRAARAARIGRELRADPSITRALAA